MDDVFHRLCKKHNRLGSLVDDVFHRDCKNHNGLESLVARHVMNRLGHGDRFVDEVEGEL